MADGDDVSSGVRMAQGEGGSSAGARVREGRGVSGAWLKKKRSVREEMAGKRATWTRPRRAVRAGG
jgi:hypothetical protein